MLRLAAITTNYNEQVFLAHFITYYAPRVDTVFLIDNESTDDSVEKAIRGHSWIGQSWRAIRIR